MADGERSFEPEARGLVLAHLALTRARFMAQMWKKETGSRKAGVERTLMEAEHEYDAAVKALREAPAK